MAVGCACTEFLEPAAADCPFCGHDGAQLIIEQVDTKVVVYYMRCWSCLATGPRHDGGFDPHARARADWNRRE
jgi:hypothetical protein